jgi:hypothetical protein
MAQYPPRKRAEAEQPVTAIVPTNVPNIRHTSRNGAKGPIHGNG